MFELKDFRTSFLKDFVAVVRALSKCFLGFFRKRYSFFTGIGATLVHFFSTGITLDKQQMTGLVDAIYMGVTRGTTLVALGNDILRNTFAPTFVKDKVFPYKLVFQLLIFNLPCIFDDPTFQLIDLFKPFMLKIG